jgi:hypothetical protein
VARNKVLALLRRRGLLSEERIELLDSWRRSGFSVHNRVFVHPRDGREFEALVRCMMRPPVSLSRLHFTAGSHEVVYVPKAGHDDIEPTEGERIDAMEFVARVLVQIPDPRRRLVRYYGASADATRSFARLRSRPSLWPPPLEIRPARRSQAERKGRRVGPSSVPKPSRGLGRSLHPGPRL